MTKRTEYVRLIAIAGLTGAVAGCAGPKPIYDYSPPPPMRERAAPPRPDMPRPAPTMRGAEARALPPVSRTPTTIGPSGPSGPLTVARVSNYIDALEIDVRRH